MVDMWERLEKTLEAARDSVEKETADAVERAKLGCMGLVTLAAFDNLSRVILDVKASHDREVEKLRRDNRLLRESRDHYRTLYEYQKLR